MNNNIIAKYLFSFTTKALDDPKRFLIVLNLIRLIQIGGFRQACNQHKALSVIFPRLLKIE